MRNFYSDTDMLAPQGSNFGLPGSGPQLTEQAEDQIFGLALRMIYTDTSDSNHHRVAQWRFLAIWTMMTRVSHISFGIRL